MIALSLNASFMYLGFAIGGRRRRGAVGARPRPISAGSAAAASRRRSPCFCCADGRRTAEILSNCRLMGCPKPFRGCGIWSKDSRARGDALFGRKDAQQRAFFCANCSHEPDRPPSPRRGEGWDEGS